MEIRTASSIDKENLFANLDQKGLLLTVNNRLCDDFITEFNHWKQKQGLSVWESPQILPLSTWLKQQFSELTHFHQNNDHCLTTTQERLIWTNILQKDAYQLYTMPATSIAKTVIQAWQLIQQWQIPMAALSQHPSDDQIFAKWCSQFEKTCLKNHWISSTVLINKIIKAIDAKQIKLPKTITFAGFQDPNQQHQNLFKVLKEQHNTIFFFAHQNINQQIRQTACHDFLTELNSAAHWAKDILQQSPEKQIVIIIPSIKENRALIEHQFNQVLHPEKSSPPPHPQKKLFNLTLGQALSEFPLINDALLSFVLLNKVFSLTQLNQLLSSFFLFKNDEGSHEADTSLANTHYHELDLLLRSQGRKEWTLASFIQFLKKSYHSQQHHDFIERLENIQQAILPLPKKDSSKNWAKRFLTTFQLIGWPGNRSLDSHEYQQSERFIKLLNEFSDMDIIQNNLTPSQAMSLFKQMTDETIFQEKSAHSPIQISGLLEASDQQYDHLWLIGNDDKSLPAQPQPNPFIPIHIQRQYHLPHCSAEREFTYTQTLIEQFKKNATDVVFSYATKKEDQHLRPSYFLHDLTSDNDLVTPFSDHPYQKSILQSSILEFYEDEYMPALAKHQIIKGGTSVLTQHANCPFKANASFRLMATEPEMPSDGVRPIDWGNQVHQLLEKIWRKISTSRKLESYDDEDLTQFILPLIKEVMSPYRFHRPDLYKDQFYQLETDRLLKLMINWLNLEKKRNSEFKVLEQEQEKTLEIGGLVIKTKADRIDQLESGERIIIDYKTGKQASSQSWFEENISEPQLPLYSLNEEQDLIALSLAKVNDIKCSFSGIALEENILPGVKAYHDEQPDHNWPSLKQQWRTKLTALASSYRHGEAYVNPNDCRYCHYKPLCRHYEVTS